MEYKLGRQPRKFNPGIMHLSAILPSLNLPTPPESVDWTKGITQFGMMLNSTLGDCTCAAVGHARQIWTSNTTVENTISDNCILALYEAACGYNPSDPTSDQGGNEQAVLTYLLNTGIPLNDGTHEKISAFVEVDPRNTTDIKLAIQEFGGIYIGIEVPLSIYDMTTNLPKTIWDYDPSNTQTEGGHAIFVCKYDNSGVTVISWGSLYLLTWEFFQQYTSEAYAIVSPDWISSTGKTPLGLSLPELEAFMVNIKE